MEVYAVVQGSKKPRKGRGFSRTELKEGGLNFVQALKRGIQIDPKRSTKHDENVKTIMKYLVEENTTKKPKAVQTKPKDIIQKKVEQPRAKATVSKSKLAKGSSKKVTEKQVSVEKKSRKKTKDAKKPLDKKPLEKKTKKAESPKARKQTSSSNKAKKKTKA